MPTHKSPKERREIVAEFRLLLADLKARDASAQIAEKYGIHQRSVELWARKAPKVELLTSKDFEVLTPDVAPPASVTIKPEGKRLLEIVASDIHFPYEDHAAYQLFLDVAEDLQPDVLVLLGDIMDCYAVSAHDKDADRGTPTSFINEILYTKGKLNEIRDRLPNTRIIYFEGNHETRLSRYINKNAAALSKLQSVTLPEFLDLRSLQFEWIPNGGKLRIGRLWHIHGNEVAGGGQSPARLKYSRMQCSFIFGHHHQRDKFRPRAYDGSQHGAYANPCLCDLEPEYLHHAHNWSQGFTIIDHDTDLSYQVEEIEVIKPSSRARTAKSNVRGKIYTVDLG
jgi:predicted phosphodiesterase